VIPKLPELNLGFASCYPKFLNKIRVSGISGSGSGIPGSGFGLWFFCPALDVLLFFGLEIYRRTMTYHDFTPYFFPLSFEEFT
jgi:hypothetical protein